MVVVALVVLVVLVVANVEGVVGCGVWWEDTGISDFQRAAGRGLGPTLDEGHQSPAPVPVGSKKSPQTHPSPSETSSLC